MKFDEAITKRSEDKYAFIFEDVWRYISNLEDAVEDIKVLEESIINLDLDQLETLERGLGILLYDKDHLKTLRDVLSLLKRIRDIDIENQLTEG